MNVAFPYSRRIVSRSTRSVERRGAILVLAAIMVVVSLACVAFSVDVGFILLTKTQLQSACDAAALGAAQDLKLGLDTGASAQSAEAMARQSSVMLAGIHASADKSSIYVDSTRDVRFGQAQWNSSTKTWTKAWGVSPYNLIEVTAHRDGVGTSRSGDGPLNLFFAPVIGHTQASLYVQSTAVVPVGIGIRRPVGSNGAYVSTARIDVLPIAVDEDSWSAYLAASTPDQWCYSSTNNTATAGTDGLPEINIYPTNSNLPSGNRGTVDLGSPNNSTNDLKRQIVNGLNDYDLSFFPGNELRFDNGPLFLNGDTGLSAGIESSLKSIIGQPRLIPIFRSVSGHGNNAEYEIVKFVGVRLLYVELSGSPANKKVVAQRCAFSSSAVIRGSGSIAADSYFAAQAIIK